MRSIVLVCIAMIPAAAFAQQFSRAIEDNSFYIEEAYNQEDRVVQHILTETSRRSESGAHFEFTQEWPAFGRKHQVSYTVPFTSMAVASSGLGDLMVHYRYQMVDEPGIAVAPRVSFILPTGSTARGLGNGTTGVQVNLPASKRWSDALVTHFNAGYARGSVTGASASAVTAGTSVIYLAEYRFNLLLEALYTYAMDAGGTGSGEVLFSPGIRCAVDIGNLQIVPGLAVPQIVSPRYRSDTIYLYLSFEHPY